MPKSAQRSMLPFSEKITRSRTRKMENRGSNLKALVIYWSATGNTEKVSRVIFETLEKACINTRILKMSDASNVEFYDYDLVFFGAPPYQFTVPEPVMHFIKDKMKFHNERGDIKPTAPKISGKKAVIFCTYSGPHTGIREAIPAIKYMGQYFEHIGFTLVGEWYVVGEFHNNELYSIRGALGDIRGRPDKKDLAKVRRSVNGLIKKINNSIS
jgi:flavodoxin